MGEMQMQKAQRVQKAMQLLRNPGLKTPF